MKKTIYLAIAVIVILVITLSLIFVFNNRASQPSSFLSDLIKVDSLSAGQTISSPLVITGQARGSWFFEADFPVELVDQAGNVVATGIAQAQSDWMTQDFVPFQVELIFKNAPTGVGKLILKKDNPSGLPENDNQLEIPVTFAAIQNMTVNVYFGNTDLNKSNDCGAVYSVKRDVPKTTAVARAAVEQLLLGPTEAEKSVGYFTSINPGVKIQKLTIENGTAKIDFSKDLEDQVGGSCRVGNIREQIIQTLKQFASVKGVVISIDGRTEDILQP
ncbi:MAG: GerMN domain-containing protein [Candidatus Buchananbacteria bacterium]|nr:GerMN domain-containing protein [Candidatus Buchananbacteria bacterium]